MLYVNVVDYARRYSSIPRAKRVKKGEARRAEQ